MKTGILAVAGLCWVVLQPCQAETPTGWPVLKITSGKEFREVKVTAVELDGIKIAHADGVARVPYELLPEEVRGAFAFDPTDAAKARATRQAAMDQAQSEAASQKKLEDLLKRLEKTKTMISGEIVQVLPDGLLLTDLREFVGRGVDRIDGNAILKGDFSGLVDGERVRSEVYPAGVTQYEDRLGSTRTVRLFFVDLAKLVEGQKNP